MMAEPPSALYVTLERGRVAHVIGDDEHTECGLLIPPLTDWTRDEPAQVCAKCRKVEDGNAP